MGWVKGSDRNFKATSQAEGSSVALMMMMFITIIAFMIFPAFLSRQLPVMGPGGGASEPP